jgi:imidazolonepropionase-like amidohydrolase
MKRRVDQTLRGYVCSGVTTAISLGGPRFEFEVKARATELDIAPNVFASVGPVAQVPAEMLFPPFDGDMSTDYAPDAESMREIIRREAGWGADLIKTGYLGFPTETDFAELIAAAVDEGRKVGLKVNTHAMVLEHAKTAMRAGVASMAHIVGPDDIDEEFVSLSQAGDVIHTTTAMVFSRGQAAARGEVSFNALERRCGDPEVLASFEEDIDLPDQGEQAAAMAEALKATSAGFGRNIRAIYDAGLHLATGSDAGNVALIHGASLHRELELMQDLGIPPLDIIKAATLNGARIVSMEDELGTVEAGKLADFVILEADPLADIANTQAIEAVVKAGRYYPQAELVAD